MPSRRAAVTTVPDDSDHHSLGLSGVPSLSRRPNIHHPGMMSRPLAASSSRIPRSEVNVFSKDTGRSASALGKRGAAEAGFDEDPAKVKRDLARAQAKIATLERDLSTSHRLNRDLEEELTEQRGQGEAFRAQRDLILKGEANERGRGEERENSFAEERIRINSQLSKFRLANDTLSSRVEELQSQNQHTTGQLAALKQEHLRATKRSEGELGEASRQVESLKAWQRRAQSLTIDLEEQKRIVATLREGRDEEAGEKEGDEVLRKEFRRQSQQFVLHQQQANSLKTEVTELRQYKKQAESTERAQKEVERDLREQIWTLQEQLERSRRDMDSLTQTFPSSPTSAIPDAQTLQSRLSSLSALHNQATADLAQKESEIRNLDARLSRQSDDSRAVIQDLTKKLLEAERECRWAKEGRVAAEKGEEFARKRAEAMESGSSRSSSDGGASGDQGVRIGQLEKQIELYKAELAAVARDSRDLEDRLTQGAGLVKQTMLDEALAKVQTLQADITALQATISELTTANTTLDAEVTDLMRRVASGEYDPAKERCIEFANNPAAKEKTIRRAELDQLRSENEALLEEIQALEESKEIKEGDRYVPRESWERLQRENREMETGHTKRLQRLKEIFSMKSKEFLEAVYSLLGWRIKFDESGADIRLTSMYAPKGKMGLTLKFASQEGHFGTMQMTGAMAKGLEEARTFWIVERQSVPGFLAQVTTECFEKTTIGRAAGYVGLE